MSSLSDIKTDYKVLPPFSHCVCMTDDSRCAYQIPAASWVKPRTFIILICLLFLPVYLYCVLSKREMPTKDRNLQL